MTRKKKYVGDVRKKKYVGDAIYVDYDSFDNIVITTEDDYQATNRIIFEPLVWRQLLECVAEIEAEVTAEVESRRDEREGE